MLLIQKYALILGKLIVSVLHFVIEFHVHLLDLLGEFCNLSLHLDFDLVK